MKARKIMYNVQVPYHLKKQTFMELKNEKPFPSDTRELCVSGGIMSFISKF